MKKQTLKRGDVIAVGAYKGAVVATPPASNGWARCYHPSNIKNGQTQEDVTFSARSAWLLPVPK